MWKSQYIYQFVHVITVPINSIEFIMLDLGHQICHAGQLWILKPFTLNWYWAASKFLVFFSSITVTTHRKEKAKTGGTRVRTGDLSICSRMLYHWAIPPLIIGVTILCISSSRAEANPIHFCPNTAQYCMYLFCKLTYTLNPTSCCYVG